jgi:hypothetical protein
MLLSKQPVQKQDHPPKFPSLSPRRPNPVHPKILFLHDAVDHVRIGFEPAGQTEGSQNRWITIPSQNSLLRLYLSLVAGGILSKTSFSLVTRQLTGSHRIKLTSPIKLK